MPSVITEGNVKTLSVTHLGAWKILFIQVKLIILLLEKQINTDFLVLTLHATALT
jgi:hypothetical protein